jgi:hypothetical protein
VADLGLADGDPLMLVVVAAPPDLPDTMEFDVPDTKVLPEDA